MRPSLAILLLVQLTIHTVASAQYTNVPEKFSWNPAPMKGISFSRAAYFGFNQQQQLQMRANMASVVELIHQLPVLNPPRGYEVDIFATLCEHNCDGGKVITAESSLIFQEYFRRGNSTVVERDAEGPSLNIHYNSIGRIVSRITVGKDEYFEEPYLTRQEQGFPVYGNLVVITKRKEPLFIPLPKERYFQIEIAAAQKRADEVKKSFREGSPYQQWLKSKDKNIEAAMKGFEWAAKEDPVKAKANKEKFLQGIRQQDSMYKACEIQSLRDQQQMVDKFDADVKKLQQELAGLSVQEKVEPMIGPNSRQYMQINPGFFDPKLPPSALQILVIDLFKYEPAKEYMFSVADKKLFADIQATLDLVKLQSLLQ
ncbi:hypothetical protein [Paraflavitalea sp. CAU 1676]|uniref:hypothetical protein n=1 Tax=Paraflavitalea sp. CAU 1676 TaxID=3032598 RepID=UPI0023DBF6FE|nr:hypothetical protein [Paraflavitalea sp. CAU 1676]MDF2191439.1 hypothetical protein [Paraflavitalea sp. CAU 1676]